MQNGSRRMAVKEAVRQLVTNLSSNEMLDVRYSMVHFASRITTTNYYKDAFMTEYWTRNTQSIIENSGKYFDEVTDGPFDPEQGKGTNYQAGLLQARSLLLDSRPDAQKYVIFLSDGKPTFHYDSVGNTVGDGRETSDEDIVAAETEAQRISNLNGFYSIRVGTEAEADEILQRICDAAQKGSHSTFEDNFRNFPANDMQSLLDAFEKIEGSVTQLLCTNVQVHDTLSQYVEPVMVNGKANLEIVVTNAEGEKIDTPQGITASIEDRNLVLSFPKNYKLQEGYTYTVKLQIEATNEAYKELSEKGEEAFYTDIGDKNTGDFSEKKGIYTNGTAKVTYYYNNIDQCNEFSKPVIRLHPGNLIITKQITGDILKDEAKLENLKKCLRFEVSLNGGSAIVVSLDSLQEQGGVYTITDERLQNLKPGTNYTIKEIGFGVDGYECETKIGETVKTEASGTISASQTDKVAFTNTYTAQDGELIFTKTLEGLCDGDTMALFTVEIKNTKTGKTYYKTLSFNNSKVESFTIALPVGDYKIRELQTSGYTNGTITGAGVGKPDENGYYSFKVPAGGQIELSVTNKAKEKNPSIDTNIAINSFSNNGSDWTWVRN